MAEVAESRMEKPILLTEREEIGPQLVDFADGQVAYFTREAPVEGHSNQDCLALIPYGDGAGVIVVADGAGGLRDGAEASRRAVEAMRSALAKAFNDGRRIRAAVLDGIERANRSVLGLGSGGCTTISVVQIIDGTMRPYHVGDSMILSVGQRGRIKHQNLPHGPVSYAVEAGMLDESEAMLHEDRHIVSNMIGVPSMRIEIGSRNKLAVRDTTIAATDGLSDNLFMDEIVELVRKGPIEVAAEKLAELAHKRMLTDKEGQPGKPDDLTFAIYRPNRR